VSPNAKFHLPPIRKDAKKLYSFMNHET